MTEHAYKSDFLRTMQARGYIHQITHPAELDEAATQGVVTGYIGFDATAASLHVGHLIQIMLLRRLQQAGHKPIVLMGGGTTKVGDPSFKDTQRPPADRGADRREHRRHQGRVREVPDLWRRSVRRHHGRQ